MALASVFAPTGAASCFFAALDGTGLRDGLEGEGEAGLLERGRGLADFS